MSGLIALMEAKSSPYLATTPGRKFSMKTSAVRASERTSSLPSGVRMSMASERLPALQATKPVGVSPSSADLLARITSPARGGSILMTSAPICAR